ncbi:hypothetical protein [Pedomonas mirosovicensis]|uniref:hypothetical protein n=1 Tax=Pedomonas mirosovicensis TaxID=2908641 RepID=UPI002168FD49|nr:hypothetical protein [Pedomonas mirosovicensis]MCH8683925.1 hypothetical protein [Pedomonas mirosovicensis]
MANTPKDWSSSGQPPVNTTGNEPAESKGQKQARKEAFRNQEEARESEAKWFVPEPREEASTDLPETPTQPYSNTNLQQGEGHPSALAAGGASDTGDKSRNIETSRNADRLEPGQEANRGIGADPDLIQNRHAEARDVTHLGSAPYQGTGEGKTPGAGLEPGEGTGTQAGFGGQPRQTQHAGAHEGERLRESEAERDASRQPGATSGMAPADQLGTRDQGHPGRTAKGERPRGTQDLPLPQGSRETGKDAAEAGGYGAGGKGTRQSAESPEDMRDRQAREAGADTRGFEKQKASEGPNAKQTLKRGAGDDTSRH